VLLIVLILLLTPIIAAVVVLYGRLATIASFEHVDQVFYRVTVKQDYFPDEVLETGQAMNVLKSVSQTGTGYPTQWSSVYNLNQFSMDTAIDRQYGKVYHFTAEDFQ
jgi:hypothetical protein